MVGDLGPEIGLLLEMGLLGEFGVLRGIDADAEVVAVVVVDGNGGPVAVVATALQVEVIADHSRP